jgi:hypothetical protein
MVTKKIVFTLVAFIMCFPLISYAADVSLTSDGKVPSQPFQNLQQQIDQLNLQLQNIQLIPGPQGPMGPAGPAGGTISGTVNCGYTSGYLPVYILGESFSALTTAIGAFRLSNVPEGTYDITIAPPGSSRHYTILGVSVTNGQQNSLGTVDLCCPGNDLTDTCKCPDGNLKVGTKCVAVKSCMPGVTTLCPNQAGVCSGSIMTCLSDGTWPADCDYTAIPGYAPTEICGDGLDNNCDGQVDEKCL